MFGTASAWLGEAPMLSETVDWKSCEESLAVSPVGVRLPFCCTRNDVMFGSTVVGRPKSPLLLMTNSVSPESARLTGSLPPEGKGEPATGVSAPFFLI